MEFGFYVPNVHHGMGLEIFHAGKPFPKGLAVSPRTFREVAVEAEQLGYDALWVGDHVFFPPHTESPGLGPNRAHGSDILSDDPIFDPLVTLTYMAALTNRIKLATNILVIPYRNPILAAKWLANLDVLSNGRVIIGLGTGWMKEEFDALRLPFEDRGAVTVEYIELMKVLWTEENPIYNGEHYQVAGGQRFNPKPIQGSIPFWGGGNSSRAIRRAAKLADGWIPAYMSFEDWAAGAARLREALKEEGRDEKDFVFGSYIRLYFYDEPYPDAPPGIGSAKKIIDDVKRFQDLGVQHLELSPPPGPTTELILEQLRRFADEVMPKFK